MTPINKPLNCEAARELMFDYLDGELDQDQAQSLEAHVAACEPCRNELETRRALMRQIAAIDIAPPAGFRDSVMARVRETPKESAKILTPKHGWNLGAIRKWSTTVAAACAVLLLIVAGRGMIGRDIVEDNAPDTGISLMCADEDGAHREIEPVDRDSVTEEKKTEVTKGTRVEGVDVFAFGETTSAVTTFAPPSDTPAKPAETDIVLEAAIRKDARTARIDAIIEDHHLKTTDRAVVIGYADDLTGLLPETEAEQLKLGEATLVDHYVIAENAADTFAGYVTLLEDMGASYRALVPENASIETFELVLIVGEETGAVTSNK